MVKNPSTNLTPGAEPVLVDVDRKSGCLDPAKLRKKITPDTRAIMPVHLYGIPADMDEILAIARDFNIPVIEDAAEAHGAQVKIKTGKNSSLTKLRSFGKK